MLYYGRQSITEEDIQFVSSVLRGDLITTGPMAAQFENEFAKFVGAKHAVAVCNATAALHLAMLVAEIGAGDRVVTSPNTFLASANCAAYVGATPDFADIDPATYNLSPEALQETWQPDTKAVIAVHYAGGSADMPAIAAVARERNAIVIEDACHALGGSLEVNGDFHKIGGHPWADMATFSFHPVKNMTTGEGGMLVTNNDEWAQQARTLRTHGIVRQRSQFLGLGSPEFDEWGGWYYEMQCLGYNYRITDFQCALGLSQLRRLDSMLQRRREIVARYNQAFGACRFLKIPRLRNELEESHSAWHLYTLQVDFEELGVRRLDWAAELRTAGIEAHVLYIPVHLQPWYRQNYGYGFGKCPQAERLYQNAVCLPLFPAMCDDEIQYVISSVLNLCKC
jgi:UDP-4-amino-4,6-dideoxy-N-acetyl-beta-L-altrosamine transaminase